MYNNFDKLTHASITPASPTVHAAHPFKNKNNHDKLLQYIKGRLFHGKKHRDSQIMRYAKIDRDVAGWMRLSDDDKARQEEQTRTGIPKATAINLPLSFIHLDDMMTYYAETFAPNRGMFYHTAKAGATEPATQIVTLMNNHAIHAGMYRHTLMSIFNIMKYNLGGFYCYWTSDYGPKIQRDINDTTVITDEVIWEGNRLEALDMYNTFWDPSVHPVNLHREGEWAGRAFVRSHYWLASRASNGMYFNCDEALEDDKGVGTACQYYRHAPAEARLDADESTGATNWINILSEAGDYYSASGYELVEVLIRINPNDFNLLPKSPKDRNHYEVWRITLLNDEFIIETTYMPNAHGQIPMYFGMANDDFMGTSAKSPAELIGPLQNFASHLLNTHVLANRKKLWGITWYDPTVVDYSKIPDGEVAAQVPCESSGYGKDLSQSIYHDQVSLETKQTMGDLESVMNLINQFFPTQSLPSQVASIDRAIDSQVAAVQQGSNRRQHKTAKLLDDSLFRPTRACMYYNIIQFQKDDVQISDFTGGVLNVNLDELRKTDLPFIIGQGLKAIDRMMIASKLQQVIFALLQSQQAQQVDVLGMINYWTDMLDIELDFNQFRLQPQQPPGAQADPNAAPDPNAPPAAPVGVKPMTNPQAMTRPLMGNAPPQGM